MVEASEQLAPSRSRMLGPAVNRQPGFRRGLVEQSNAAKNNPAVSWQADCMRLLAAGCRLLPAAGCCNVAGCWPLQPGWFNQAAGCCNSSARLAAG